MGHEYGGCSYIDQQRNLTVRVTKEQLAKGLAAGVIDPEEAAIAMQEREDEVHRKASRNSPL